MVAATDWWQTFFSGLTVEWWLRATTPEQTRQEADFIVESLDVTAPAKLLDVPCGGGRHCMALAERGYDMTGVDISTDFLAAARVSRGARHDQGRTGSNGRCAISPGRAEFDGAYSFGNSFGYLDDAGNADFLKSVATRSSQGPGLFSKRAMSPRRFCPYCRNEAGFRWAISCCSRSGAMIRSKAGCMSNTRRFAARRPRNRRCRRAHLQLSRDRPPS